MQILESQSATLSNHEVLAHIQSLRAAPRPSTTKIPNLATVVKELTSYLSPPPSISPQAQTQPLPLTPHSTRALLAALRPYGLTKAELLMVVNLLPAELGLLDCVVEECDLRFGDEEQGRILGVVEEVVVGQGEKEGRK